MEMLILYGVVLVQLYVMTLLPIHLFLWIFKAEEVSEKTRRCVYTVATFGILLVFNAYAYWRLGGSGPDGYARLWEFLGQQVFSKEDPLIALLRYHYGFLTRGITNYMPLFLVVLAIQTAVAFLMGVGTSAIAIAEEEIQG